MRFEYQGFFGLLVLVADIWAIISIIGSDRSTGKKVLWVILVLILPILGWLIWLIMGPRAARTHT